MGTSKRLGSEREPERHGCRDRQQEATVTSGASGARLGDPPERVAKAEDERHGNDNPIWPHCDHKPRKWGQFRLSYPAARCHWSRPPNRPVTEAPHDGWPQATDQPDARGRGDEESGLAPRVPSAMDDTMLPSCCCVESSGRRTPRSAPAPKTSAKSSQSTGRSSGRTSRSNNVDGRASPRN